MHLSQEAKKLLPINVSTYCAPIAREAKKLLLMNVSIYCAPIAREATKLLLMNVSKYCAPYRHICDYPIIERVKTMCTKSPENATHTKRDIMHANYYRANLLATYHSYLDKHFQLEVQNTDTRDIGEYL